MLEDLQPPVKNFPCRVRTIASELSEADSDIFVNAINNHAGWSVKGLETELRARGVRISEKAISNHRKQRCSCA